MATQTKLRFKRDNEKGIPVNTPFVEQTSIETESTTPEAETVPTELPQEIEVAQAPAVVEEPPAEITSAPQVLMASKAPVEAAAIIKPAVLQAPAAPTYPISMSQHLVEIIEMLRKSGAIGAVAGLEQLMLQMDAIAPNRPVDETVGARHQAAIYRAIKTIIQSGEHFRLAFTALVMLIVENSGTGKHFHDMYAFRYTENLSLPAEDQHAFRRIINLIKILGPVADRKANMKTVSFSKSLQYGFNDDDRQRIQSYFSA